MNLCRLDSVVKFIAKTIKIKGSLFILISSQPHFFIQNNGCLKFSSLKTIKTVKFQWDCFWTVLKIGASKYLITHILNLEYHMHDSEWITENHPLTIHKLLSIYKYVLHFVWHSDVGQVQWRRPRAGRPWPAWTGASSSWSSYRPQGAEKKKLYKACNFSFSFKATQTKGTIQSQFNIIMTKRMTA